MGNKLLHEWFRVGRQVIICMVHSKMRITGNMIHIGKKIHPKYEYHNIVISLIILTYQVSSITTTKHDLDSDKSRMVLKLIKPYKHCIGNSIYLGSPCRKKDYILNKMHWLSNVKRTHLWIECLVFHLEF